MKSVRNRVPWIAKNTVLCTRSMILDKLFVQEVLIDQSFEFFKQRKLDQKIFVSFISCQIQISLRNQVHH